MFSARAQGCSGQQKNILEGDSYQTQGEVSSNPGMGIPNKNESMTSEELLWCM